MNRLKKKLQYKVYMVYSETFIIKNKMTSGSVNKAEGYRLAEMLQGGKRR